METKPTDGTRVEMSAEELAEYMAFKAERDKKREAEQREAMREQYAQMVDDEVAAAIPQLLDISEQLAIVKTAIYGNFETILKLKGEIIGAKIDGQRSHTFTTSDSQMRLTLGVNMLDAYRDTVEDGIAMVKEYLESLAQDEKSKALVNAVLKLLARDNTGSIKASRVLQLRRMAQDSKDEKFIEGVKIIEESYQPTPSARYVRAEVKDERGAWKSIPLAMTDCELIGR
jgi:Protein of unknown function (DUF3164)